MARRELQDPAQVVEGVLERSSAYAALRAAVDRRAELVAERDSINRRVRELETSDLGGIHIVSDGAGNRMVEEGRVRMPLAAWRERREARRRAEATYGGRGIAPSPAERAMTQVAELSVRLEEIEAALPIADERISEATRGITAELAGPIRQAYKEQVAQPLAVVLEAAVERAERAEGFTSAIADAGLSPNLVSGLPLAIGNGVEPSFIARCRILLGQIERL